MAARKAGASKKYFTPAQANAMLPLEVAWGQATLNPTAVAASKLTVEPVWVKPPPEPAPAAPAKS